MSSKLINKTLVSTSPVSGNIGTIRYNAQCNTIFGTKSRVNFSVAHHDDNNATVWHNVTLFGRNAQAFMESYKTGDFVEVAGVTVMEKVEAENGNVYDNLVITDPVVRHLVAKSRVMA